MNISHIFYAHDTHNMNLWCFWCCNIVLDSLQCFSNGPMNTASICHHEFAILSLYYPFICMIFVQFHIATGWNCSMFHHLGDSALVLISSSIHSAISLWNYKRQAVAFLLYRRQNRCMYWVHPINQSHQQFGENCLQNKSHYIELNHSRSVSL